MSSINLNQVIKPKYKHNPHDLIKPKAQDQKANPSYFTAKDLSKIYGFPVVNNNISNVIGVISFGGGLYGSLTSLGDGVNNVLTNGDVQKYWDFVGISAKQMPKVIVSLQGNTINDISNDATVENTLDVSIIGACVPNPNLTIIIYIFPNYYSFSQALPIALAGITISNVLCKPSVLSISWGLSEEYIINTSEATNVFNILQTATQNGVNICVSAGDNGSTDGSNSGLLYNDFPSSCPFATSVGGTSLQCPNIVYDSQTVETVWNNGVQSGVLAATGGGISRIYNKPSYQSNISSLSSITMRCSPDISLDADPNTGIVIYLNNQLVGKYGGTSISAPLFASYLILINANTFINPLLYNIYSTNTSCFHDITVGSNYITSSSNSNNSYTAKIGYDFCSGLGSIYGSNLTTSIINFGNTGPTGPTVIQAKSISINNTIKVFRLNIQKNCQFTVNILPGNTTNKNVIWTSSNTNVITIDNNGLAIFIKRGNTNIKAQTTDGSNLSSTIKIIIN